MRKLLLIGVGGTGGKTLRYLHRELERRLAALGWEGALPDCWQFIHVDAPQVPDGYEEDVPLVLRDVNEGYVPLGHAPHLYRAHDEELAQVETLLPALAGWRPNPNSDQQSPWTGAGQRRAIGRVLTLTGLSDISAAIDAAILALDDPTRKDEFERLSTLLDPKGIRTAPEKAAIVVSSMGGGTGSGAFLDVVEILLAKAEHEDPWLRQPMTVLFAPDVFESKQGTGEVPPNTLGALSELMAAFEHDGDAPAAEVNLLTSQGLGTPASGRRTAEHNFLIGRRSSDAAYPTAGQVYRSTAKALAAMLLVPEAANELTSYVFGNWRGAPLKSPFAASESYQACSSFGYGSVTLGRNLFAQYASERLARAAVRRLLDGHKDRVADSERLRDETIVKRFADGEEHQFFERCGLFEVGLDHNQVLDALRYGPEAAATSDLTVLARGEEQKRVGVAVAAMKYLSPEGQDRDLDPKDWKAAFGKAFDIMEDKFSVKVKADREANAKAWSSQIQQRVLDQTVDSIGAFGLPATIELLARLKIQVGSAAAELDQTRSSKLELREKSALEAAKSAFDRIAERINLRNEVFKIAAKSRQEALRRRTEAGLYEMAATLLRELAVGLLPQLTAVLQDLYRSLLIEQKQKEIANAVATWPVDSVVPSHLEPTPNEVLLEPADTFPQTFSGLMQQTLEKDYPESAFSDALTEVITGRWRDRTDPADELHQDLIQSLTSWGPSSETLRVAGTAAGPAAFETTLDTFGLLARAERWVRDRDGAFATHVAMTLADYLQRGPSADADRAEALKRGIKAAVELAAPLASVSPQVARTLHGLPAPKDHIIVSPIPIDSRHRAAEGVSKILANMVGGEASFKALLDPGSRAQHIEILRAFSPSMHPVVFSSVMSPILESWNSHRQLPLQRETFWRYRRSRPLESFVPVAPGAIAAMVRGWFVASLLNHLQPREIPKAGAPLQIWSPDGLLSFPAYLLGAAPATFGHVLPALLESMPLAFLQSSANSHGELHAYERLSALGGHRVAAAHTAASPELSGWIATGRPPKAKPNRPAAPLPEGDWVGTEDHTPAERKELVETTLTSWQAAVSEEVLDFDLVAENFFTMDPRWELRHQYRAAFDDLLTTVRGIETKVVPKVPASPV